MKYAFFGNRFFSLEVMLDRNLDVEIAAVKGSYLEKELLNRQLSYVSISAKREFLSWYEKVNFDVFVSNGGPYLIPVDETRGLHVNIHPSYLPDLRGPAPIIGAILLQKDGGATVHVMDREFDNGDIISQVRVRYDPDRGAAELYQLSFAAERKAFEAALSSDFLPRTPQKLEPHHVYFRSSEQDRVVDLSQDAAAIRRRILAFDIPGRRAYFLSEGWKMECLSAHFVKNGAVPAVDALQSAAGIQSMLVERADGSLRIEYRRAA